MMRFSDKNYKNDILDGDYFETFKLHCNYEPQSSIKNLK